MAQEETWWAETFCKIVFLPVSFIVLIYLCFDYPIPILSDPSTFVSIQFGVLGTSLTNLFNYFFILSHTRKINKWLTAFVLVFFYCFAESHLRKNNPMGGPFRCDQKCLNIGGCRAYAESIPDTTSSTLLFSTRFRDDAQDAGINITRRGNITIHLPQVMESRLAVHPDEKWEYVSNVITIISNELKPTGNMMDNPKKRLRSNGADTKIKVLNYSEKLEYGGYNVSDVESRPTDTKIKFLIDTDLFKITINGLWMVFYTRQSCAIMEQTRDKAHIIDVNPNVCSNSTTWDKDKYNMKRDECGLRKNRRKWTMKNITDNLALPSYSKTVKLARKRSLLPVEVYSFVKIATGLILSSYYPESSELGIPVKIITQVPAFLDENGMWYAKIASIFSFLFLCADLVYLVCLSHASIPGERRSLLE